MNTIDDADVALSRSGMTSPLGKLEEKLFVFLDERSANELRKRAADLDQVPGEWLRDLVYREIHGKTLLELLAEHRRSLLDRQGANQGSVGAVL